MALKPASVAVAVGAGDAHLAPVIQLRRGTAAEWTAANPVLESGEKGFEEDTGLEKTGDGVTPWNELSYAGAGGEVLVIDGGSP